MQLFVEFDFPMIYLPSCDNLNSQVFAMSAGLGWKSWKKRWFILTRTSLVFFKNDPVSIVLSCDFISETQHVAVVL